MTWNFLTGLIAIMIGVVYGWQAWRLPRAMFGDPTGHLVYPVILSIAMTILGLILMVKEIIAKGPRDPKDSPKFGKLTRHGREIAMAIAASLVYAMIFEPFGYVFSTMLYLGAVLFIVNGRARVLSSVLVAVLFSVGVYVLFSVLLGIQLPRMPILDI
ncbi:MAG: tripartite tricarboxylate transporter TctB family protein [Spirochaetota bacterium]